MSRFVSLRTKLILLSVLSIALPFAVVGTYTYLEYSERVAARARRYSDQLLRQIAVGVERYLKQVEDLSLAPLYDDELITQLKRRAAAGGTSAAGSLRRGSGRGSPPTTELMATMRFFTALRFDRNEVRGVGVYALDGALFSYSEYFANADWKEADEPWMARAREAAGAARILPATGPRAMLSLVRLLREPFTHAELGFIRVEFSTRNLERAIFPTLAGRMDYVLLVYNAQEELIYPSNLSMMAFVGRPGMVEYGGVNYLASVYRSEPSGLTLYGLVPYAEVAREAQTLSSTSALIAAVALVLACALAVLTANRIVSPLQNLAERMASVREGRFEARAVATTHDEVGELAEDFNLMATEIQRLINKVYLIHLKEQEAEIMLLQSQINPHFLYNTLETISMMAVERDRLDISDTVTKLGKMLRYSSTGSSRRVPLSSEISLTENYMAIQTLRLGSRISIEFAVNPVLYDCLVPKLCLQPFAENVIDHSLDEAPVRICVSACAEGSDLLIRIEDDGKGLTAGAAAELEAHIRLPDSGGTEIVPFGTIRRGIALRNIHHRIAILHGEGYGISVSSGWPRGAVFEIRLPLEKE